LILTSEGVICKPRGESSGGVVEDGHVEGLGHVVLILVRSESLEGLINIDGTGPHLSHLAIQGAVKPHDLGLIVNTLGSRSQIIPLIP
jgi:hypothetical protein